MKLLTPVVVASLTLFVGCEGVPKAQYYSNAVMPLVVTAAPITMKSGSLKAGEVIGRHTVAALSGAVLDGDVAGVTRLVPAGTILAEGIAGKQGRPIKIYCDVRPTDAFSSYHEVDCFEDTDADGAFDAIWTGRPSLSMTLFSMSLSSAGYHGVVEPIAYRKTDKAPETEIGLMTYVCWNGQPAFLLAVRRLTGHWETATGPCGVGDHPGEIANDGVFSVSGVDIKVIGNGDTATFDILKRIPPGPIAITSQRLQ